MNGQYGYSNYVPAPPPAPAYGQQPQGYAIGQFPDFQMAPPQYYGPPQGYGPPMGWGGGGMPNGQNLLATILPLIITLPGLTNGRTIAANLQTQLTNLQAPAVLASNATPTATDYNNLSTYITSVKNAVTQAVGNDVNVFAALRQALVFQMLFGMMNGGGGDPSTLILVLALGGGTGGSLF